MAREYDDYRPALKGSLLEQFKQANPEYWSKLQNRPQDIERVSELLSQTEEQIERLELEYDETWRQRVQRESIFVWDARARESQKSPDQVQDHVLSTNSVLQQAKENVDLMHSFDKRREFEESREAISKIANGEHHNSEFKHPEEIEKMSETEKEKSFKAEIHAAVKSRQTAEYQARKLFASTREEMIDTARENGSKTPEQDVKGMYRAMMQNIEKQCHKDVHEVFERYGWDYEKQGVTFNAKAAEQDHEASEDIDLGPSNDHEYEQ